MSFWNQHGRSGKVGFSHQLLAGGGTVYGVVLNDHRSLHALGNQLNAAPYMTAPNAPILYIKPRNTIAGNGSVVTLPGSERMVEIGATIGIVLDSCAARLETTSAAGVIKGYVVVADLSLPHGSYYRPAIREKCFDSSCIIGDTITLPNSVCGIESSNIITRVDGKQVATRTLADLVRPIPELLKQVSDFMTLQTGDVLLTGVPFNAPTAGIGSHVEIEIEGIGALEFSIGEGAQT